MTRRYLTVALTTLALCAACGDDESGNNTANNTTASNNTTNTTNTNTSSNSNTLATKWSAELMGGDALGLPEASGTFVIVASSSMGSTVTGATGETGANLAVLIDSAVADLDVSSGSATVTASTFTVGFALEPTYKCTGTAVEIRFTTVAPYTATFEGTLTCVDTPDQATSTDVQISGRFET